MSLILSLTSSATSILTLSYWDKTEPVSYIPMPLCAKLHLTVTSGHSKKFKTCKRIFNTFDAHMHQSVSEVMEIL